MTTLKDVAREAGCSLTTVSIIANGRGEEMHISQATQERVQVLIEQMGYRPNRSAQLLRNTMPKRPVIAFYWPLGVRINLLGARLLSIYSALAEQGLNWEIVVQPYTCDHLTDNLSPLSENRCSGAIIGGASEEDMRQIEAVSLPVQAVLINLQSHRYSTVGINHSNIGAKAAALISKKGYKTCAIVKSSEIFGGTMQRTNSFLYNCREHGVEIRPEWMFSGDSDIAGGARATEEYCTMAERPPIIYYENDSMAQGGLYTLKRHGIRVPDDVEILSIGLRDPEDSQFLTPSVSCIEIPSNVEKQAVSLLARLLKERPDHPIHIEMEPLIRLRESFTV